MNSSSITRRQYAKETMTFNMKNPLFRELFKNKLNESKMYKSIDQTKREEQSESKEELAKPQESFVLYGLYILLGLIVFGWMIVKGS